MYLGLSQKKKIVKDQTIKKMLYKKNSFKYRDFIASI